jgi:predicted nucleic acid-binding OB-fold protein
MWKTYTERTLRAQERINDALIKFMENSQKNFNTLFDEALELKVRVASLEAEVYQLKKLGR